MDSRFGYCDRIQDAGEWETSPRQCDKHRSVRAMDREDYECAVYPGPKPRRAATEIELALFVALAALPGSSFVSDDQFAGSLMAFVTKVARHVGVCAIQFKIGVRVVVKPSGPPIVGGVAFGTDDSVGRAAKLPLMDVFMTRLTLARGIGKRHNFRAGLHHGLMAPEARYRGVTASKRELSGRVIKPGSLLPTDGFVTAFAGK